MMVDIFSVEEAGQDGEGYFPNLREAKEAAQSTADHMGISIEVRRDTIDPALRGKKRAIALLTGGWASESRVVHVAEPRP